MIRHWSHSLGGALLLTGLTVFAWAQEPARTPGAGNAAQVNRRGGFGFLATLERAVGLSDDQRDTIRGLLATQREKTEALRRDTDTKIRALLTADQQKKFDALRIEQQNRKRKSQR